MLIPSPHGKHVFHIVLTKFLLSEINWYVTVAWMPAKIVTSSCKESFYVIYYFCQVVSDWISFCELFTIHFFQLGKLCHPCGIYLHSLHFFTTFGGYMQSLFNNIDFIIVISFVYHAISYLCGINKIGYVLMHSFW